MNFSEIEFSSSYGIKDIYSEISLKSIHEFKKHSAKHLFPNIKFMANVHGNIFQRFVKTIFTNVYYLDIN